MLEWLHEQRIPVQSVLADNSHKVECKKVTWDAHVTLGADRTADCCVISPGKSYESDVWRVACGPVFHLSNDVQRDQHRPLCPRIRHGCNPLPKEDCARTAGHSLQTGVWWPRRVNPSSRLSVRPPLQTSPVPSRTHKRSCTRPPASAASAWETSTQPPTPDACYTYCYR